MKLNDLNEWEKPDAILDKDGNVLCPYCKRRFAIVNKYGMVRSCKKCEKKKDDGFMYSFVDANGFKSR